MNSRQRLLSVINGEIPDRVPVSLFIHDEGNFLSQIYKNLDLNDPIGCKYKLINLQRELGVDIHLRILHGLFPVETMLGVNTEVNTDNWKVSYEKYTRGNSLVKKYRIKTPERDLFQENSISKIAPGTFNYACTKKPIKDMKDLEAAIKYEPPIKEGYSDRIKRIVKKIKDYLKDDGVTSIWAPGGSFNAAANLIDLNMLYSVFLIDEVFFKKLIRFCIRRTFPIIKAMCNSGVDIINIGGNVPGGFLGKKFYDKYVLPYEKEYIDFVKSFGLKALYHNCGESMGLIDSYKELEPDIVEPFSPPPMGDGNLKIAKKKSEGKFTIIGNLDQVNVLQKGSINLVKEVTKNTITVGKPGGKYIFQTADYLEYGTPLKNVEACINTAIKYGKY